MNELWKQRKAYLALCAVPLVLLSACSSSKAQKGATSTGGGGLPATIKVLVPRAETGIASGANIIANKGTQLAIAQINEQHFLGATTIEATYKDTAFSAQTAASQATAAIADPNYAAILGPLDGIESKAVAPIAARAGMPQILHSSAGIKLGPYVYSTNASMKTYYYKALAYLQSKNVKTLSIVYDNANPTLIELATKVIPSLQTKYGFKVQSSTAVPTTLTDFQAPMTKAADDKSDAVAVLLVSAANTSAMKALRQDGFNGPVIGNYGASGTLGPAGQSAVGMTWPVDFSPEATDPNTQAFVKAYQAMFQGQLPTNYAAQAYDGAWMLARAIKASGSATREGISKGLATVAKTGFVGAGGKLSFVDNIVEVPGVVVQWNGTKEALVPGF